MKRSKLGNSLIVALTTAFPTLAADKLEPSLGLARRKTFDKAKSGDAIMAMDSKLDRKQVEVVFDALVDVDDPEPAKKDNEDPEPAKDCAECHGKDGKHGKDCKMGKDAEEDEEDEPKVKAKDKKAKDGDTVTKSEMSGAMDSMSKSLREQFRAADEAKREVRAIVGDVVAMDSASEIYAFALDEMKVEHEGITDAKALRALFKLAHSKSEGNSAPIVAMDSNAVGDAIKAFPGMGRIR